MSLCISCLFFFAGLCETKRMCVGLQDPFLVILEEDEEDETSLLDKAVEANMEFLKVSLDRTV